MPESDTYTIPQAVPSQQRIITFFSDPPVVFLIDQVRHTPLIGQRRGDHSKSNGRCLLVVRDCECDALFAGIT